MLAFDDLQPVGPNGIARRLDGVVGAAIVNQDYFDSWVSLSECAFDRLADPFARVVSRDENRNKWIRHRPRIRRSSFVSATSSIGAGQLNRNSPSAYPVRISPKAVTNVTALPG